MSIIGGAIDHGSMPGPSAREHARRARPRENTPGAALERLTDLVKIGEGCVRLVATFERGLEKKEQWQECTGKGTR